MATTVKQMCFNVALLNTAKTCCNSGVFTVRYYLKFV